MRMVPQSLRHRVPPRLGGGRRRASEGPRIRLLQQKVVAELGLGALKRADLAGLMDQAVASVAQTLAAPNAEILQLLFGGDALLLRAGGGGRAGRVGGTIVGAGRDSPAGYTLLSA